MHPGARMHQPMMPWSADGARAASSAYACGPDIGASDASARLAQHLQGLDTGVLLGERWAPSWPEPRYQRLLNRVLREPTLSRSHGTSPGPSPLAATACTSWRWPSRPASAKLHG